MLQGLTDTVKRYARPAKDEYTEGMTLLDVVKKVVFILQGVAGKPSNKKFMACTYHFSLVMEEDQSKHYIGQLWHSKLVIDNWFGQFS